MAPIRRISAPKIARIWPPAQARDEEPGAGTWRGQGGPAANGSGGRDLARSHRAGIARKKRGKGVKEIPKLTRKLVEVTAWPEGL